MKHFDRLVRVQDHREMGFCLMFGDSFHTRNHNLVCYALLDGNFIITSFTQEIAVLLPGMRKWRLKEIHPNNRYINAHLWAVERAIHYAGIYPISVKRGKW